MLSKRSQHPRNLFTKQSFLYYTTLAHCTHTHTHTSHTKRFPFVHVAFTHFFFLSFFSFLYFFIFAMTNPFDQHAMASHNSKHPGTVARKPPVTSSSSSTESSAEDTCKQLKRKIKEITEVTADNLS